MAAKRAKLTDKRSQFEQVALPHLDAVYSAALRLARNPDDAADLLQDTILRAYRFFHQFAVGTNCRAWLLTILYNNFRNTYRRSARERTTVSGEEFDQEMDAQSLKAEQSQRNPEDVLARRAVARQIETALNTLPEDFREALVLVDVQELNYQEVAEVLDIPLGTVKSRVSRARALMREALQRLALMSVKTGT